MKPLEIPIQKRLEIYTAALRYMKTGNCPGLCNAIYETIKEMDFSLKEAAKGSLQNIRSHPAAKYLMLNHSDNYPELIVQCPTFPFVPYDFWWEPWKINPRIQAFELAIEMCKRGIGDFEK